MSSSTEWNQQMSTAIHSNDAKAFVRLLPSLPDNTSGDKAMLEALGHRQWSMVSDLLGKLGPGNVSNALAHAANQGTLKDLCASIRRWTGVRGVMDDALVVAASMDMHPAVAPLLEMGSDPSARDSRALFCAILERNEAMALRLAPLSNPEAEQYRAVIASAAHGLKPVLACLLDLSKNRQEAIQAALPGAGCAGQLPLLDMLLGEVPTPANEKMESALGGALVSAARTGRETLVKRLLPLCLVSHSRHEALLFALLGQHDASAKLLVAAVNVEAVKMQWLKLRPPKWEAVEKLAEYIPEEVSRRWLSVHKTRFSKVRSVARQARAHDLTNDRLLRVPRSRIRP